MPRLLIRMRSEFLGPSPDRESALGQVLVMMNGGRVTEPAKTAFDTALNLQPEDPKSSFYLAIELSQTGHPGEAIKTFRAMEKRLPPTRRGYERCVSGSGNSNAMTGKRVKSLR